jgi:SPP1 family predicted phage head-tail adaptor
MKIGELRHRVTIQELVRVPDGLGGYSESWRDVATIWASIEPLRGQELYLARQTLQQVTHRVVMRYIRGVTRGMRIVWGERVLRILAVIDRGRSYGWLELMCEEVA